MPLTSDVSINVAKFDPASNSEQTKILNDQIEAKFNATPAWYEVGAPKYREMRLKNETALPGPVMLPQALDITIPSREQGRDIPCRLMYPQARKTDEERKGVKGVVMHIHGGGWVLGDEKSHDGLLQFYADAGDLAVISIGYRLAPENPFPKGPEDCVDAAEYLVKNAESAYGGPLKFMGGESAGAHLSVVTTFHLLKTHPEFTLSGGLLLHFGCYDLSGLPNTKHFTRNLILNGEVIEHFVKAFVPTHTPDQRKEAAVSPYYEDFSPFRGKLPSALFTIGTEDPLLDDTVTMSVKWMMFGGEAIVKVFPGGCHGFISFPPSALKEAGEAMGDTKTFIEERVGRK
ncbi:Alpha/Beta hydrolase protein [Leptodontidium sp. MPI-SDFR-AT-0119]|nr:Alpha/Beta hydrolase protein [Leptodontidium sp. MPI-SDFR-AT-0119]